MAVYHDVLCPLHSTPLVDTPAKPALLAKCINANCYYGVVRSDPSQAVQDISDFNYTADGEPSETLD